MENNNINLLNALAKYNEWGKLDFALHNAIKNKDLISSVILTHYSKNVNTRKEGLEYVWNGTNAVNNRPNKSPIELALDADMIGIIPYLLMKNADPYFLKQIGFLYEEEKEDLEYLKEFGCGDSIDPIEKKICTRSKRAFFDIDTPKNKSINMSRTIIGDAIAKNRLDVIEILHKSSNINWNKICCSMFNRNFSPLQFALAIKRYEIAQFLIDHGAKIE
jgi:ankyrin repeat protein